MLCSNSLFLDSLHSLVYLCLHSKMPQAYVRYVSCNSSALRVHNAHAPIVIKLDGFLQPFVVEALRLSKWIVGACGKYLQLSMYGATGLEPQLT